MVAAEKGVDVIIATQAMYHVFAGTLAPPSGQMSSYVRSLVEAPARVRDRSGKPLVIVLPIGGEELDKIEVERRRREIRDTYRSMGIPSYPSLERAVRAVAHTTRYYERRAEIG